jgi:hypothetical protein
MPIINVKSSRKDPQGVARFFNPLFVKGIPDMELIE